jgi:hypothetical protein
MRSAKKRIAATSCASLTVTMPLTSAWITGKVSLPLCCVCAPSAMVLRRVDVHDLAARQALLRVVAGLGLDAPDRDAGQQVLRRHRAAGDQPATAHAHQQRVERPTSSISSSAAVPCPAITCGWS